jgi:hypothetical protein
MSKKGVPDNTRPAVFGKQTTLVPEDDAGEKALPNVLDCLLPRWKDGRCVRESGRIGVRVVGCYFVCTLTCPSEGLECSVSSLSIVGLIEALEKVAADPNTVWTPTFAAQKKARQDASKSLR